MFNMAIGSDKKYTVLVVEDNEINKDLLYEYLSPNYNVLLASNGTEALDIIDEKKDEISLIFLDIVMPYCNGFEVLEDMNETGAIASLPVVIISSEGSDEFKSRAYLNNVCHFITKPFTYEEVMACAKAILA